VIMGRITKIEWCHHTFNPWWGCTQVGPLCDHCYAMMLDARWFKRAHFGPRAPLRYFGGEYWAQPLKWNDAAAAAGRRRVFCASMADVFDNKADPDIRDRLWELIGRTPNLDWLLLTKRIGNARKMLPADWGDGHPNVWLIVSTDQAGLERDVETRLASGHRTRDQHRAATGAGTPRQARRAAAMGHQWRRVRRRLAAISPRMGSVTCR
jgi:protein gp37